MGQIIVQDLGTHDDGLSDRGVAAPTLEERMDDVRAVMNAAGSERAAIMGISEGGALTILFAASHPARTSALILFGTCARWTWAPDHPWALSPERVAQALSHWEIRVYALQTAAYIPATRSLTVLDTRISDERMSASPSDILALLKMVFEIDCYSSLARRREPGMI